MTVPAAKVSPLGPIDLFLGSPKLAEAISAKLGVAGRSPRMLNAICSDADLGVGALAAALEESAVPAAVNLRMADSPPSMEAVEAIRAACAQKGVPFRVDMLMGVETDTPRAMIDGQGVLADIARRTETLVQRGIEVAWLIPLTPLQVYRLEMLVSLGQMKGARPVVLPAAALSSDAPALTGDDRLFAWDFVTYAMLGRYIGTLAQPEIDAYRALQARLYDEATPAGRFEWSEIGADGALRTVERQDGDIAARLLAPHGAAATGLSGRERLAEKLSDLADVAAFGVPSHLRRLIAGASQGRLGDLQIPAAMLIGAYGGEHIGDAAILGGVLHRIHARHGTRRAILMTQRPNHTRHLIPMLEVPVEVEVREYTGAEIRRTLGETDGVVFAGGPLTDLPKQLVRHLDTVTRARRGGKPFVMEGIGPGTFVRKPSEVTARALVKLADRITIRTKDDEKRQIIGGLTVKVGRDPAFDYLETRGPVLTRMRPVEPGQIDELLAGTEGRPVIGVNVRPIGHLFTVSPDGQDAAGYTRSVESRFEQELAKGMAVYAGKSGANPCFVFFPMNAIQFGMSDLTSAFRIMQHLPKGVDFRVWEADASLDGVIALMRRMRAIISMRFHGVIFALSQSLPVIGIDYRIGKRDKVAAVLADAGQEEFCQRIDELQAEWLADQLGRLLHPGS